MMSAKKYAKVQRSFFRLTLLIFCLIPLTVFSNDRVFNYTYQSNVLTWGQKELEVWTTVLSGRDHYYRKFKNRVEFEVGLGKRWQTAFYLNFEQAASFSSSKLNIGSPSFSFSNEWKYKISDPVADAIGSAAYFEYIIGPNEFALEFKAIFDKQMGKFLHAFNVVAEPEWSKILNDTGELKNDFEVNFEFDYALGWKLNKQWFLGVEVRNHNEWREQEPDGTKVGWEHSALFAGPTISFSSEKFWVNFTALPQIAKVHHYNPNYQNAMVLDEHEKLELRVLFSFVL